jgi:hypothetical protein
MRPFIFDSTTIGACGQMLALEFILALFRQHTYDRTGESYRKRKELRESDEMIANKCRADHSLNTVRCKLTA